MKILARSFAALALFAALASTPAAAQLFRAYLAIDGNDANPCTLPQPCRLLPAALNAVASGGEIWMLDSANYNTGTVTIGKSVSILAVPGVVGSFVTTGANALTITADGLSVSLRNVVIVPLSGALGHGIVLSGASELFIEDATIANIGGMMSGVLVGGTGSVRIAGTTFRDIGGYGVALGEDAQVSVSNSRFLGGINGIIVQSAGTAKAFVTNSSFQGVQNALLAFSINSGLAEVRMVVSRCAIEGANTALYVDAPQGTSEITVGGSTVTHSTTPWFIGTAGVIRTQGNNLFTYNGAPTGALTAIASQ